MVFSIETLVARRQWANIAKVSKKLRYLKINKGFVATRPDRGKILKVVLYIGIKGH